MGTGVYTDRLKLINPTVGREDNWDVGLLRNRSIQDVVAAQELNGNSVASGCVLSGEALLEIDISLGVVSVDDTVYDIEAGTLTLTDDSNNWVYVNDSGTLTVSTTAPTGSFAMVGMVDTDSGVVSRYSDLRKFVGCEAPVESDCINGMFHHWQRDTSQTSSGFGSDDRWMNEDSVSTKTHERQSFTVGQTVVPDNPEFFSRTTVASSANSSAYVRKGQSIKDVDRYSGKTICVDFWAKASLVVDVAIEGVQNFGTGGSAEVTGIDPQKVTLSVSWQRFTVFVDMPSISGKTVGTDSFSKINFWFDAGSNYSTRTDSLGQQSAVFDLSHVDFYVSKRQREVRVKLRQEDLKDCLAYYRVTKENLWSGYVATSQYTYVRDSFSVEMIKTPTVTLAADAIGTAVSISTQGFSVEFIGDGVSDYAKLPDDTTAEAELS